jgi:hypothetical protein
MSRASGDIYYTQEKWLKDAFYINPKNEIIIPEFDNNKHLAWVLDNFDRRITSLEKQLET